MLTYSFADSGSESLYEHLYNCIKEDVLKGILAAGERLPSKRSFAKHLNISVITVENAYAQLVAEGYIYSVPKKGYFVADLSVTPKKAFFQEKSIPEEPVRETYFADFFSNHTRAENFPFSVWAKLMREVLTEGNESLLLPPPSGGLMVLRRAIARHLHAFRGIRVEPEQIIIGAGTEYLYELLIQLLGRDKVLGLENPGYKKIGKIYESNDVNCCYIDLDEAGMDIRQLETTNVDIIHLSPSHHYPTGIVTPISRRYELLGWALKKEGRYIIEDDYDCEFRLQGKPIPALQSIDVSEKVIYMNTFTKSLASTIRISYMVLPRHLLHRFYEKLGFYACTVSNFEQYTLARFIEEGYFEKHINRMRSYYRKQRDRLILAIKKSSLSAHTAICEEDAGLHFLLKVETALTDEEIVIRAKAAGIRLTCLSQYYHMGNSVLHTLVINYSGLLPETVDEAVRRLADILG